MCHISFMVTKDVFFTHDICLLEDWEKFISATLEMNHSLVFFMVYTPTMHGKPYPKLIACFNDYSHSCFWGPGGGGGGDIPNPFNYIPTCLLF